MAYVIAFHILAGAAVLMLGLVALRAAKRRGRHTRAGDAYFWLMAGLLGTGVAIGATHPGISPFEIAVVPTGGPLLVGYAAGKLRRSWLGRPWFVWHIGGMGGSFIGVISAGLFQTAGRVLPQTGLVAAVLFAAPSIAGSLLIARAIERRIPAAGQSSAASAG